MAVWAAIAVPWVRRELHRETVTWGTYCESKIEKGEMAAGNESEAALATENGATNGNPA